MKIVYVDWIDGSETEKYHKDVLIPKGQGLGLLRNWSVGIVVEDNDEYISLAQSLSDSGWYRDIINIARINITAEKVLLEI